MKEIALVAGFGWFAFACAHETSTAPAAKEHSNIAAAGAAERRQLWREARHASAARAKTLAAWDRAAFWCFTGEHKGREFGECKPTLKACNGVRGGRQKAGVRSPTPCEPFAEAMCFNATRTLKKGAGLYCFPQPHLCTKYRAAAHARGLFHISDCGVLS